MNKAAWINLCSLHMQRLRPRIRPDVCLMVARLLYDELGPGIGPQVAAMMEASPLKCLPAPGKK